MSITWSRVRAIVAGGALILATNAVALVGVAYNRAGEPESQLRLTEREAPLPWRMYEGENSGIALALRWRVLDRQPDRRGAPAYYYSGIEPAWLDENKLRDLGFDVSKPLSAPDSILYYEKSLSKEVLLVLEYDGPAYQSMLERAGEHARSEAALAAANSGKEELKRRADAAKADFYLEERINSRLFVVDAGLDGAALRAHYPDRSRYAIVRGQVRPIVAGADTKRHLAGYITNLSIETVHVPFAYRGVFEPLLKTARQEQNRSGPRYEFSLAFGKRLEPWITAVSARPL